MDVSKVASAVTSSLEAVKQSNSHSNVQQQAQRPVQGHEDTASLSRAGLATVGSDVRPEKIASVQEAIAAGSYNVHSSDVADKILTSLLGQ